MAALGQIAFPCLGAPSACLGGIAVWGLSLLFALISSLGWACGCFFGLGLGQVGVDLASALSFACDGLRDGDPTPSTFDPVFDGTALEFAAPSCARWLCPFGFARDFPLMIELGLASAPARVELSGWKR